MARWRRRLGAAKPAAISRWLVGAVRSRRGPRVAFANTDPDAIKFTLDTTLPAMLNVTQPDAAAGHQFAEAVFAVGGVASIFGVDDFVTVTRQPGCEWDPIIAAVVAAAAASDL